jgi:hypothetical protein
MNRVRAVCIWAAASWRAEQELVRTGECNTNTNGWAKSDAEAQSARIRIFFGFMGKPHPAEVSKFKDFKEIRTALGFNVETFETFETLFLWAAPPHGHARIPAMDILLKIASRLSGAHAAQFLNRRFQQFGNVILDLLANARFLQRGQQIWSLNVGEPAAQRALYDVVIDHGHPRCSGNRQRTVPLRTLVLAYPLEAGNGFGTVISVAGDCD